MSPILYDLQYRNNRGKSKFAQKCLNITFFLLQNIQYASKPGNIFEKIKLEVGDFFLKKIKFCKKCVIFFNFRYNKKRYG